MSSSPNMFHFNDFNNNYIEDPDYIRDHIGDFYKDTCIFVTGATGFVGKALVDKLLRSCSGLNSIYLLMRPKKGRAIEERLKELLDNPVFSSIKKRNPDILNRIKAVAGDITLPNLGISAKEYQMLIERINVVFHSAATVRFDEELRNAFIHNTLGTKKVLEMCNKMQQLKSFVYVSTAYSNSDKENIDESVYELPFDYETIMNSIEMLPQEAAEVLSKKLLGRHPNTYTLTKAMAEHIVLKHSDLIPSAIVRPSIITASWKEPQPGWVDSVSGITGIFMEVGRGTIKSIICKENMKMDIIPVDTVINTVLTAAWHTVAYRSNTMRVYNCTSGNTNPITWKEFRLLTEKYSKEYPSKYVTWYPGITYRTNRALHAVCVNLFHHIPAAILDVFLFMTKRKPFMLKMSRKFEEAIMAGKFFSTNQWNFEVTSMRSLTKAVQMANDGEHFDVDISENNGFKWDDYVKNFILGVRQFILKDDLSSLNQARSKLNRLYWFQKMLHMMTFCVVTKMALSVLMASMSRNTLEL
ncbi:unnamed protein product [Phaedon cochleariae]|uniref:Fatty acyl-CoA reductase n=1 Tax=Phaedon cochleariae TaxID=80249 RepID=A0A9P0DSV4_PHACE|nr:unnamed protein product [Phaedon cochleariae]